jgi:hypothetical protein
MKLMKNKRALLLFAHLAGWIIFIWLVFLEEPRPHDVVLKYPLPFVVSALLLIGYFYLNLYCLVPRLLSKKRILAFVGSSVICFLVICTVLTLLSYQQFYGLHPENIPFPQDSSAVFPRGHFPFPDRPVHDGRRPVNEMRPPPEIHRNEIIRRVRLYNYAIQFLVVFIISTGLKVITQWYREKQQLHELEKSRVQAELSFLKSQIHPHFLFNCLNSIYYLALSQDDKAPKTILSLSDFLRFVFTESDSLLIPMEKEIKMLEEYLNLQSLRTSEKFELRFVREGDFGAYSIMPLTFIPFVENAFKYGLSAHTSCFIHIRMTVDNGTLIFTCDNSILSAVKDPSRSSGIGLDNIRKRLELTYPGRYSLKTGEDSTGYHVKLQITVV